MSAVVEPSSLVGSSQVHDSRFHEGSEMIPPLPFLQQRNVEQAEGVPLSPTSVTFPKRHCSKKRTLTWVMILCQTLGLALAIATLTCNEWCRTDTMLFSLNKVEIEGRTVDLRDLGDWCESSPLYTHCSNPRIYHISSLFFQSLSSLSIVFTSFSLSVLVYTQFTASFHHYRCLKKGLFVGPGVWVLGVGAICVGFARLKETFEGVEMGVGFALMFSAAGILLGAALPICCLKVQPSVYAITSD